MTRKPLYVLKLVSLVMLSQIQIYLLMVNISTIFYVKTAIVTKTSVVTGIILAKKSIINGKIDGHVESTLIEIQKKRHNRR